jgi:hypothetical protein
VLPEVRILARPAGTFGPLAAGPARQIIEIVFAAQERTISTGFGADRARPAKPVRRNWLTEAPDAAYGEEVISRSSVTADQRRASA